MFANVPTEVPVTAKPQEQLNWKGRAGGYSGREFLPSRNVDVPSKIMKSEKRNTFANLKDCRKEDLIS